MSLSAVSDDNIYVLVPDKPNYIKVVYNRLCDKKNSTDVSIDGNRSSIDNIIHENINKGDDPSDIFNENMVKLYTTPYNVNQYKYIFIGECSSKATQYLDIIQSNVSKSIKDIYTSVDVEFLREEFKYKTAIDMKEDFQLEGFYRVIFIRLYISTTNTLNQMYKLCSVYLSNNEHDDIITVDSLYMYGDIEDEDVDRQYQTIINSILYNYKLPDSKYTIDMLRTNLLSFLIPPKVIDAVFLKYTNITQIFNILDTDIIEKYIKLYIRFAGLGYTYATKGKLNYAIDSNLVYYLLPPDDNNIYTSRIEQKLVSLNDSAKFKTVQDINVKHDTLYFYNYYDLEKLLLHKNKLDESVKLNVFETVVLKLFPDMSIDNMLKDPAFATGISSKHREEKTTLNIYAKRNQDYYQYSIPDSQPFTINFNKQYIISIRKKINIPNNFDFRHVFNKFNLSNDIPFVKFRDVSGTNDIIYKVFKNITSKESINHIPLVTKDTLDSWVKYKGYEFENLTLKSLRNYPKNISFKYKFMTSKKSLLLSGLIYISHGNQYYDIITNTNKIYTYIHADNIEHPSSENLSIDYPVKFFENDIIYADIDIYKKKFIEFTLDTRNLPDMSPQLLHKMTISINDFSKSIFQNDILNRYATINQDISISDFTTKLDTTYIHSLIYQYRLDLPKQYEISYTLLEQAANLLFPFVFVNESIFNEGDNIKYYHTKKSRWINGIVKSINVDGTYNLQINDNVKGSISTETVQDVKKISIKPSTPDTLKIFNMIYKQVSDFNEESPIAYIVKKLSSTGLVPGLQVHKLMSMFVIDHEKASSLLSSVNEDVTSLDSSSGIEINIDYTKRMHNSAHNDINIYISNVKSVSQIKDVFLFLNLFIELCLLIQYPDKIRDTLSHIVAKESEVDKEVIKELENTINTTPSKSSVSSKSKFVDFSDDDDSDIEYTDDDEDEDDDDIDYSDDVNFYRDDVKLVTSEPIVETGSSSKLHKEFVAESTIDLQLQKGIAWSSQLNLLKAADKDLFDWGFSKKTTDGIQQMSWARTCQGSRQPRVLSDFDKIRIDSEFAKRTSEWSNIAEDTSAYAENLTRPNSSDSNAVMPKYIDCDETTMVELKKSTKDKPIMCKSLKWGSSADSSLHNWYICPKIFELNTQTPLHINDLKWGLSGDDEDKDYIKHTFIGGNKLDDADSWRTYNGPESVPADKRDILHFNPYYEITTEDGVVRKYFPTTMKNGKQREPSIKYSLELVKSGVQRFIPGLMVEKHPQGFAMPCCYKSPVNVLKHLNPGLGKKQISMVKSSYIQSWGHGLSENKYGLLPGILAGYFMNKKPVQLSDDIAEANICKTGQLKDNIGCFVRNGVRNDYNNFLAIIAKLNGYRESREVDGVNLLVENIINNLNETTFRKLNKGDLYNIFKYNGIQSPLQNFIEYLVSTQHKKMEFLYDLLTNKKYNIVKHDYFFVMFDYNNVDNTLSLICPSFCDTVFDESRTIVFLIKTHGQIYEPVGKIVHKKDTPIYKFTIDKANILDKTYLDVLKYSNMNHIFDILRNKTCSSVELIPHYVSLTNLIVTINRTPEIGTITHLIRDDYNKIVGVYLDNGATIPVHPQHYSGEPDIAILMHKDVYPVSLSMLTTIFTILNKTLGEKQINIDKLHKTSNNAGTIVTNLGTYIKVDEINKSIIKHNVDSLGKLNNDHFHIDSAIELYNKNYNKLIYNPALSILEVNNIIQKDYIKSKYSVTAILTSDDTAMANALLITRDLVIPILSIEVKDVIRLIGEKPIRPLGKYRLNKLITLYMNEISSFSRLTGGVLGCVPIRGLFETPLDEKTYGKLILESGLQINIAKPFKFKPLDINPTTGKLLINELIDTPIIHNIFSNTNVIINKALLSERVRVNMKLNYNIATLDAARESIFKIMQDDKLTDIREYILYIINNRGIHSSHKKIYIRPLMVIIFRALFKITLEEELYSDLNNNFMCYLTNCENAACDLSEPLQMPEFDRSDDNDIIKIGMCPFGKTIDSIKQDKVQLFITQSDVEIRDKLVINFRKLLTYMENKGNLCKIKVINDLNYTNMQDMIFHELLFNKSRRDELINYHNKYVTNDSLELNESTEVIFMNSDYTTDKLNKLYLYEQNKYYNTILPFNASHIPALQIDLKMTTQNCILEKKSKQYQLSPIRVASEYPIVLPIHPTNNESMYVTLKDRDIDTLRLKLQRA